MTDQTSPVTETVLKALEEAREEVCKTTHNLTVGYKLDGFDFAAEAVLEALGHAQCPDLSDALSLAVNIIMANEPGDSRAVSNEAVALAAVVCGDTSDAVMAVIRAALAQGPDTSTDSEGK